jgi:hypothetical protein
MYGPGSGVTAWREYAAATSDQDQDWDALSRGEILALLQEEDIPTEVPSEEPEPEERPSVAAKPTS